ncbi:CPBP family intramembrane glutamic endopeptidase [Granulicella cerasi]|uniref:CPBP family intramembrane glutamic endopeptidase n=1 Tax=Granulicella cerasi TaxID=741063 RepID=A0ABW1ZBT8_9BACT|nr:CPBP family intramembrane glutamic endopeptidase [Granulicella cerasi]
MDPLTPEPQTPSFAPHHSPENPIFFGRFGLRAGWGMSIYLVLTVAILMFSSIFSLGVSGHMQEVIAAQQQAEQHPGQPSSHFHLPFVPSSPITQDGIQILALLGVCWFFSKGEHRPLGYYGLGKQRRSDFLPGAIWGLVMMCAIVVVLRAGHWLVFDGVNVHGVTAASYALKWLLAFLCVGFAEEYMFRGYLLYTLKRGVWGLAESIAPSNVHAVAFWLAATIMSLLFAAAHLGNGGENAFGIFQVFLAGIVFCYAVFHTGSLWWGVGFHMTWDWAQSFLFGVADSGNISVGRLFVTHAQGKTLLSGGSAGPEGSIFASLALLLTVGAIHLSRRGVLPPPEAESASAPIAQATPDAGGFHNTLA